MQRVPDTFDLGGIRTCRQPRASGGANLRQAITLCPFTVLVDSREQLPYEFSGIIGPAGEALIVPMSIVGLTTGDYSVKGLNDSLAVERKSLEDLYGSITWGRERFEREIERLDNLPGFAAVVIEATWAEIAAPAEHRPGWENRTDPRSVEGTIAAWSVRYRRVHWWAAGDRRGAELRTFSILKAAWTAQQKEKR